MKIEEYLSAEQAASLLRVKPQTLYAYVSRGILSSIPGEKGRSRRYLRAEIERLRQGNQRVARPLEWGDPLLESEVSWIGDNGPVYRGRPVLELAESDVTFESVAELLWTGLLPEVTPIWNSGPPSPPPRLLETGASPIASLAAYVAALGLDDDLRFGTDPGHMVRKAKPLIRHMAAALSPSKQTYLQALRAPSVSSSFLIATGIDESPEVLRGVNLALVLAAEHELNPSTFVVRIAASTGSDVYACVVAGLAVLSGPRHGGAAERIGALLEEVASSEGAAAVALARSRRGEGVPGFGHPLYPAGDPRAQPLLQMAGQLAETDEMVARCFQLIEAMEQLGLGRPNVDLGLVALVAALGLPVGMASGLFALGRAAGWVAHAIEQHQSGTLLRPRAARRGN